MVLHSKSMVLGFLLIVLLLLPIAGASSEAGDIKEAELFKADDNPAGGENDLFTELSEKAELYNENFDEVPMLFKRLVASEEIALRIKLENGTMLYATAIMRGGKVGEFYSYETENDPNSKFGPTIIVETDEQTVRKVLDSDDPLREAVKSMNEGDLDVECKGFFRRTVLWAIKQLYS
ncbi:hypothetical protein FTO70_07905 [Methanosarcina sp. KYL-1]|uniref:hypothetical protein n=1 Tax=Methanosarcina sp. KYL-1 TaxID=2602068 RepID=UPI0021010BC1|nr:hypothetical protein [Methanosarcina sp. KYL-1]MCQ1535601.1 hypothetical protein [Methanosarcina sp. KYL-1]